MKRQTRLFIQQPVVPEYRCALFSRLSLNPDLDLTVMASLGVTNWPESISPDSADFKFCTLPIDTFCGAVYWQYGFFSGISINRDDVVVLNSNPRFLSNLWIHGRCKLAGAKVVSWNHSNSSTSGRISGFLRRLYTKWAFDYHLVYTEPEVDYLIGCGFKPDRLLALNNTISPSRVLEALEHLTGVDVARSPISTIRDLRKSAPQMVSESLAAAGLKAGEFLLFCGRLTEKAQVNIALEAVGKLNEIGKPISLVIIGNGECRKDLGTLCDELGIGKSVHWLEGSTDQSELAPYFLGAKLFVYPGSIGLSLNHAFQYGVPVLTHNNTEKHMPEYFYLSHGVNGLTYQYGNTDDLVASILNYSPEEEEIYSLGALTTVYEEYSFDCMVNNFELAVDCATGDFYDA